MRSIVGAEGDRDWRRQWWIVGVVIEVVVDVGVERRGWFV